jgi:glycosyltransferase involved in cell wall biosynthesis
MLTVLINTSPLGNQNAIRGVGVYTRQLIEGLQTQANINVLTSESEINAEQKPDLIHYPFFDLFFDTLPLHHKKPFVVTIHDVIPLVFKKYYQPGVKGYLRFIKQSQAVKKAKLVITDSLASKNDIHRYLKIKENKISVIPLAANPLLHKLKTEEVEKIARKYKLPANYLLYVGDINYNKNLPQLIKSLKFLPDKIKLVCVGKNFYPHNIPEWQWIETQLALSDVRNRVRFITDLSRHETNELAAIYQGAIAYVQPSLYEGFGLPILEAMQCHTPVISTHNSSLTEVGGNYVLYVDAKAESIAQKVEEVLSWSESRRNNFIKAAFKWSQTFNWDRVAQETIQAYKQVVSA